MQVHVLRCFPEISATPVCDVVHGQSTDTLDSLGRFVHELMKCGEVSSLCQIPADRLEPHLDMFKQHPRNTTLMRIALAVLCFTKRCPADCRRRAAFTRET